MQENMEQIDKKDFLSFISVKSRLSKRSIRTYSIRIRVFTKWLCDNKFESINNSVVEIFINSLLDRNLANSTINTYIQSLRYLDKYCEDRGLYSGFMKNIQGKPKEFSEIIICSPEELKLLFNTKLEYKNRNAVSCDDLDFKYSTLTMFLYITGCRLDEAASLQVQRLDIANKKAYLIKTKNRDNRYIYFSGPIVDKLQQLIKGKNPNDLVFTSSKGTKILDGVFNLDLRKRAEKAGIKTYIHAHVLRHSFATHLIERGVDVFYVSKLLGHRDIKTTERYLHVADKSLQVAAHRLPILQAYIDPQERLRDARDVIDKLKLYEDKRFRYSMRITDRGLKFETEVIPL
jgi:integrase/recombinase XerD